MSAPTISRMRSPRRALATTAMVVAFIAPAAFNRAALASGKPPSAAPATKSAETEAREAMQTGITLFGRGDAEGALREYERAKRLVPAANLPHRYAAEALVALGRLSEAIEAFQAYLDKNPNVSDAEAVRRRIADLVARVSRGDVGLRATAPGARARVDGGEAFALPHNLSLPAGDHTIVVECEGYLRLEQHLDIKAGERADLLLSLVKQPSAPALPRREPPTSSLANANANPWPIVGGVTLGVGAATLLVGAILDATALKAKFDDLDAASRANDPRLSDLQSETRGLRTGVQVTYVAGIVTLVAGLGVLLLYPRGTARGDLRGTSLPARSQLTFRF